MLLSPSKASKPGRAYLNLTKEEHLTTLANYVRDSVFTDEKGSMNDAALLGPPTVDFAPYSRVPGGRVRHDARQGTIDQDPEFIEFLESLTNPVTKPVPSETVMSSPEIGKAEVAVTPLIQYLRDKKANKGKDKEPASPAKTAKQGRNEPKDGKGVQASEKKQATKSDLPAQTEKRSAAALRVEKAAREAVRVLNKQVEKQTASSPKAPVPSPATSTPTSPASPAPPIQPQPSQAANERRRERGNASAAARMLQRDLGIGAPTGRRRREAAQASSADSSKPAITASDNVPLAAKPPAAPAALVNLPKPPQVSGNTAIPTGPSSKTHHTNASTQPRPPKPPVTQTPRVQAQPNPKPSQNPPGQSNPQPSQRPTAPPPISPSSTQAFLKHANPSQGITEPLLSDAFAPFGSVLKVEIDKKKGFAYVDFEDHESLKKAIAASPVKVAEGQVVVLERKTGGALQQRNVRGGGPANAGRGNPAPVSSQPASLRGGVPPNVGRGSPVPGGPAMRGRGHRGGRGMGRGGQGSGGENAAGKQNAANAAAPSTLASPNTGASASNVTSLTTAQ